MEDNSVVAPMPPTFEEFEAYLTDTFFPGDDDAELLHKRIGVLNGREFAIDATNYRDAQGVLLRPMYDTTTIDIVSTPNYEPT